MRSGREDAVERRKALCDKACDITQSGAGDRDAEVIAAGHQRHGFDGLERGDHPCKLIEAAVGLRGDFQFNVGRDLVLIRKFLVHDDAVTADNAGFFQLGDLPCNGRFISAEHSGKLCVGKSCILLQKL